MLDQIRFAVRLYRRAPWPEKLGLALIAVFWPMMVLAMAVMFD